MLIIEEANVDSSKYEEEEFLEALAELMFTYGVNHVRAYWGIPSSCPRCGGSPQMINDRERITILKDGDPRLRERIGSEEALGILGRCVIKSEEREINLGDGDTEDE